MKKLTKKDKPLTPRMQQVVQAVFDNPKATHKQLGALLGISECRVGQIVRHPRVIEAFPVFARHRIKSMVPAAAGRLGQLMSQSVNLEVARKVAERVLDTNKVLEPETKVTVNIFAQMSTKDLQASVAEGVKLPTNDVFDGDLVSPEEDMPS